MRIISCTSDPKGAQAPVLSERLQLEDTLIKHKTHGAGALQRYVSHVSHESNREHAPITGEPCKEKYHG